MSVRCCACTWACETGGALGEHVCQQHRAIADRTPAASSKEGNFNMARRKIVHPHWQRKHRVLSCQNEKRGQVRDIHITHEILRNTQFFGHVCVCEHVLSFSGYIGKDGDKKCLLMSCVCVCV